MKRDILITADGSTTIFLPEWNEHYHSKHGAIQEAYHVFIKNGFDVFSNFDKLSILEVGFGTGLNAFITFLEAQKRAIKIDYVGVEAYPVNEKELVRLNYVKELNASNFSDIFPKMHALSWNESHLLTDTFTIEKRERFFKDIEDTNRYDLLYFDAFGARVQPELWTESIFRKMFNALKNNGALVTYAAKGSVRRAMQAVGFKVERLPGPPGKREMLRGRK